MFPRISRVGSENLEEEYAFERLLFTMESAVFCDLDIDVICVN